MLRDAEGMLNVVTSNVVIRYWLKLSSYLLSHFKNDDTQHNKQIVGPLDDYLNIIIFAYVYYFEKLIKIFETTVF